MKPWDHDRVIKALDSGTPAQISQCLAYMVSLQTPSEQASRSTHVINNVGFNKFDADTMTDIWERCKKYGGLTPRQTEYVRRVLKKYWRQLAVAFEKAESSKQATQPTTTIGQPPAATPKPQPASKPEPEEPPQQELPLGIKPKSWRDFPD